MYFKNFKLKVCNICKSYSRVGMVFIVDKWFLSNLFEGYYFLCCINIIVKKSSLKNGLF